ncbi:DUF3515 domain-containing protein [Amycolatopsis taiwanensis]|uniref:DUF3515 domain-containing protein n=1 Tax=Amycolatopsis taiwanensis TaxID=342230 RepID=A0A9W6R243_9PSEU|nr:DUF3515 domain-containing protein [Amycolatopsis taiwanensis]GLY66990.1 hypothetical protein Atai01_36090 [Amycolatopsis taiwanensis]
MQDTAGAPPRRLIVVAAVVAVILAAGIAVAGIFARSGGQPGTGPLALPSVPAPEAGSPECATLLGALPLELTSGGTTLVRRELAAPAPAATVAWGEQETVVLRCGLERPPELTPTSQLRVVSGVQWLPVLGDGSTTWYVVDRPVYVALTVPGSVGTGPLQDVSGAVATKLPPQPLRF